MSSKRRRFSGELKAKVALEALRGDRTLQEIASQHQVHPNQVGAWKRQAIEGPGQVAAERYAVIAGGRRLKAMQAQVENGVLDADHPAPCLVAVDRNTVPIIGGGTVGCARHRLAGTALSTAGDARTGRQTSS